MGRFVPLSIPNFEGNERKYVDDALDQGWVSTGGAYITELEEKLAEFLHVEKTAAVQSGTSALHLSLIACGVQPGDMVIVPTLTFIAAVNPVRYQFAEPVFMDCDDSLCMDPQKLHRFNGVRVISSFAIFYLSSCQFVFLRGSKISSMIPYSRASCADMKWSRSTSRRMRSISCPVISAFMRIIFSFVFSSHSA